MVNIGIQVADGSDYVRTKISDTTNVLKRSPAWFSNGFGSTWVQRQNLQTFRVTGSSFHRGRSHRNGPVLALGARARSDAMKGKERIPGTNVGAASMSGEHIIQKKPCCEEVTGRDGKEPSKQSWNSRD